MRYNLLECGASEQERALASDCVCLCDCVTSNEACVRAQCLICSITLIGSWEAKIEIAIKIRLIVQSYNVFILASPYRQNEQDVP